jgi:hypothetical protein
VEATRTTTLPVDKQQQSEQNYQQLQMRTRTLPTGAGAETARRTEKAIGRKFNNVS